jgi:di/tricarboxylate transporter
MTADQIILFLLISGVLGMLLWGRIRYDLVAFGALILGCLLGVIPVADAFAGFGHPATIIVALVLIVTAGLSHSGAIELLAERVIDSARSVRTHVAIMASLSAALSAFINNVAALALLMPLDIQAAKKAKRGPALTLMPLSFASILGGMITLIGTPPNVVIATYRSEALGAPFRMFDFAPVGLIVATVGVIFVATIGWRLIPRERGGHDTTVELADLEGYVSEANVPEASESVGKTLRDLEALAEEHDVALLGLVRAGRRLPGAVRFEPLRANDFIIVEGGPAAFEQFVGAAKLTLVEDAEKSGLRAEALELAEVVVPQSARLVGRTAMDIRLQSRWGVTLLGISRRGKRSRERIRKERVQAGDILLLLGRERELPGVIEWLGCLPLAERGLAVRQRQKAWPAVGVFGLALVLASTGLVYLPVALGAVVVVYSLLRVVPISDLYQSVEWPVIVLIGSLIPLGSALEASGGAALIANGVLSVTQELPPAAVLALLMVVTMTLSDVLNNVATALIAAPIGLELAARLQTNPDAFLMGVAVASSCAFLTPIGHKNNTIILGPGGYAFGDYWRMGLPLELLVMLVGLPAIVFVWPL